MPHIACSKGNHARAQRGTGQHCFEPDVDEARRSARSAGGNHNACRRRTSKSIKRAARQGKRMHDIRLRSNTLGNKPNPLSALPRLDQPRRWIIANGNFEIDERAVTHSQASASGIGSGSPASFPSRTNAGAQESVTSKCAVPSPWARRALGIAAATCTASRSV